MISSGKGKQKAHENLYAFGVQSPQSGTGLVMGIRSDGPASRIAGEKGREASRLILNAAGQVNKIVLSAAVKIINELTIRVKRFLDQMTTWLCSNHCCCRDARLSYLNLQTSWLQVH